VKVRLPCRPYRVRTFSSVNLPVTAGLFIATMNDRPLTAFSRRFRSVAKVQQSRHIGPRWYVRAW